MSCITLILWNEDDQESKLEKERLAVAVRGAFKTKHALSIKNFFPDSIKSSAKFKEELVQALGDAQAKILDTIEVDKIWAKYVVIHSQQSSEFDKKPLIN